jgi:hypothetical protein
MVAKPRDGRSNNKLEVDNEEKRVSAMAGDGP